MSRIVCWVDGSPLLLRDVERNANGSLKSGFVVNGGWRFEIRGSECLAKCGDSIVARWPAPQVIPEIKVPDRMGGDYNDIIEWSKKQRT